MSHVFYTHVGPSQLSYDTTSNQIVFTTPMYNAKECRQEMREVTITEEEWLAIVKYGEQAGFQQ